jgi:hypothetical protein
MHWSRFGWHDNSASRLRTLLLSLGKRVLDDPRKFWFFVRYP